MKVHRDALWSTSPQVQKTILENYYHKYNMSWAEIAKLHDTYANKIIRLARKLGIESRDKSDAQKVALSEGRQEHPTEGKERSEKTRQKISEGQGKIWDSLSEMEQMERRQIGITSWNKKTPSQKTEFFKKSSEALQEASQNGSKMENYLFETLVRAGYRVEKHLEHILQNEKFHIDLYIPAVRAAIEIDGPLHFEPVYGQEKLERRQAADLQKTGLILSARMVLVRVKLVKRESQRNSRNICDQVLTILNDIQSKFPPKDERYFEV